MAPTLTALALSWPWRPDVIAVVAVLSSAYILGWRRLHRRQPQAAPMWRLALYLSGLGAINGNRAHAVERTGGPTSLSTAAPVPTSSPPLFLLHAALLI